MFCLISRDTAAGVLYDKVELGVGGLCRPEDDGALRCVLGRIIDKGVDDDLQHVLIGEDGEVVGQRGVVLNLGLG